MIFQLLPLWLKHHLDAAVLLVPEYLVHLRSRLKANGMSDDKRWIDLALLDPAQQIIGPAVDMCLTGSDRQTLVHEHPHRDLVGEPAVNTGDRDCAARAAHIDHLAEHMGSIVFQHQHLLGTIENRVRLKWRHMRL